MIGKAQFSRAERSWILYDVANSAFVLIVTTTLMPIYFKEYASTGVDNAISTSNWGFAVSIASLILALLAPVLGSIADYRGNKKKFLVFFILSGVIMTILLVTIGQGQWVLAIALYVIARICYSGANIFYDSFLTDVTTNKRMDHVSASGFGWGYIGSVIPFLAAIGLVLFLQHEALSISPQAARLSFVLTAIWWAVFSYPIIKNVHQHYFIEPQPQPIRSAFRRLYKTFKDISAFRTSFLFLLAYFFYIDGVYTVISMATAYGTDLGFDSTMLILVVLFIQLVAWPFALLYGRLAEKTSTKTMLMIGISIYIVLTFLAFMLPALENEGTKTILFWVMAFMVASSQGGIQALSRSFFGKTIPKEKSAEFYGFYNIFGKFAAIVGPFLMAIFSRVTGESRFGVLSLVILFIAGGALLLRVKEPQQKSE
jgi:UMF1 family MFS transporter